MAAWLHDYRTPDGRPLEPQFAVDGSSKLVVLNSTPPLQKVPLQPDQRGRLRQFNGQMRHHDWAVYPDAESGNRPLRPFIPAQDGCWNMKTHRDWAFQWNAQLEVPNSAPFRFTSDQRVAIARTADEAVAWAAEVTRVYASYGYQQPGAPDVGTLKLMYRSREEFNAAVWDLRRAVLLLYAYISCSLRHDKKWKERGWNAEFVREMEKLGLHTGPVRGILLLRGQLNETTIRRWMDLGVPVHYVWAAGPLPATVDPSYAPESIGAYNLAEKIEADHRDALAQRAVEKKAQRAAAETSGMRQHKKKWLTQKEEGGPVTSISAGTGKKLQEDHPTDTSRSTAEGQVAVIQLWRDLADGDDDDEEASFAAHPSADAAATVLANRRVEVPATGSDEWPTPKQAYRPTSPLAQSGPPARSEVPRVRDEDEISLGEDIVMEEAEDRNGEDDVVMTDAALAEQVPRPPVSTVEPGVVNDKPRALAEQVREDPGTSTRRSSSPPKGPRAMRNSGAERTVGRNVESRGRRSTWHDPYAAEWARRRSVDDDRHYEPHASRHGRDRPRTRSRSRGAPARRRSASPRTRQPGRSPRPEQPTAQTEDAAAPDVPLTSAEVTEALAPLRNMDAAEILATMLPADARAKLLTALLGAGALLGEVTPPVPPAPPVAAPTTATPSLPPAAQIPVPSGPSPAPPAVGAATSGASGARSRRGPTTPRPLPDEALIGRITMSLAERLQLPTADERTLAARVGSSHREELAAAQRTAAADWMARTLEWNSVPFNGESVVNSVNSNLAPPRVALFDNARLTWDPRTEMRARIWICRDGSLTMRDVLERAYRSGCPLQIWTPTPELGARIRQPPTYRFIQPLPHTSGEKLTVDALSLYVQNVVEVLSRPHARAALLAGGLLWRIALEWGPRWLVDCLWQSADQSEGLTDYDPQVGGVAYCLTKNEIDALLGITQSNAQLWPPIEFWHRYDKWLGQWTAGNEGWFVQRALLIRNASDLKMAQSSGVWRSRLRQLNAAAMKSTEGPGKVVEAEWVISEMDKGYPLALADFDLTRG
ncbi:hypothetical protein B0H11DRAFT_2246795 [Mycena galericulata]|nr:hypothetical protein B0H11DRAFT_2246795 [Mycena galericulata]